MTTQSNSTGRSRSKKGRLTTDTIRDDVRTLTDDARTLTSDARALAKQKVGQVAHDLRERADDTVESVVGRSHQAVEIAREKVDHGRLVVVEEYDRALEYVRKNPLTSMLIGVAVGAVVGSILLRRDR